MHRSDGNGATLHALAAGILFVAILTLGPARALATASTVRLFNVVPAKQYDAHRNGSLVATAASTAVGSVAFGADLNAGDVLAVTDGGQLQPPAPPLFPDLAGGGPGCAHASWLPSGDPTVVGYSLSYGRLSVAGGQATQYEYTVDTGAATTRDVCLLAAGTYYFAVRARNHLGVWSAYSIERSVQVVVVSVLISQFDARVTDEGVELSWRVEADEVVRGFRVYRGEMGTPWEVVNARLLSAELVGFIDATAKPGMSYEYALAAVKENGEEVLSYSVTVTTPALVLSLGQNAPNPFNPSTTIRFSLPQTTRAAVHVYDVKGARVATLVNETLPPGHHLTTWNGTGDDGAPVATGTYFYVLSAGDRTRSRKMVLLK